MQKYGQITGWGKKWLKGDEKRGKMHIFSPIGKKYAYFCPNWLESIQNWKKKAEHFWNWGKNKNQEQKGKNMNFKFNIHPWAKKVNNKS